MVNINNPDTHLSGDEKVMNLTVGDNRCLRVATLSQLMNFFRPISKMPFLFKVMEKIVYYQLISFLDNSDIVDKFQSGFRAWHSMESALLEISNDLLLSLDSCN